MCVIGRADPPFSALSSFLLQARWSVLRKGITGDEPLCRDVTLACVHLHNLVTTWQQRQTEQPAPSQSELEEVNMATADMMACRGVDTLASADRLLDWMSTEELDAVHQAGPLSGAAMQRFIEEVAYGLYNRALQKQQVAAALSYESEEAHARKAFGFRANFLPRSLTRG